MRGRGWASTKATHARSAASMLVFLVAEPFRFWHHALDDLARRIDPDLGGYDAEDYRRAAEIIDRLAAKPRVAGTDTEPQAQ